MIDSGYAKQHEFGHSCSVSDNAKSLVVFHSEKAKQKKTRISAESESLATIKHDLFKSIILASLIFTIEVVLYLVWQ